MKGQFLDQYKNNNNNKHNNNNNNNNNKTHDLPLLKSTASKIHNPNASEYPQKTGNNMKQRSVKRKRRTNNF